MPAMLLTTFVVYVLAVLVLTVTPGPSVLATVSTSVNLGFRQAVLCALGSTSAIVCIMALSALGLGAALVASETLFTVLKWVGAVYLAYLGVSCLLSGDSAPLFSSESTPPGRSFIRGFLVGASNPKALVFFTALFPQFIDPSRPQTQQFLILGATFVVFELSWLFVYAALGVRAKIWLKKPGRVQLFNRATGGVFLLAAAMLASSKRGAA